MSLAARQFPALVDRRVAVGGACWALTVVFFVGQALAQAASTVPYSLWANYISDLGNTACGPFSLGSYHADVCSPRSGLMNATFVVTGLLTSAGALGTWPAWPRRRLTTVGLILLMLAGAGEALAGFQSENTNLALHTVGALFGIAGANLGVLLLGAGVWRIRRWAAALSMAVAVVGVVSFALTSSAPSMGLGIGLVERIAGYPVTVWMIVVGAYLVWTARSSDMRGAPTLTTA